MPIISQALPPGTASRRFAFASFGGQRSGILATTDTAFYFFTDDDDRALDVTTCPMIYITGTVSAERDAYFAAELAARLPASNEEV